MRILIDVTRDFERQSNALEDIDAVLLTHGHADACGGIAELRRWLRSRGREQLPLYAGAATIAAVERRFRRVDHCDFKPVRPGRPRRLGGVELSAMEVPHARDERFPTFAWRIRQGRETLVYASDVAWLTPELERFSRSASLLVIDGAMWRRQLFSHLTIDRELPRLCDWRVEQIVLTQIGRTAPAPRPARARRAPAVRTGAARIRRPQAGTPVNVRKRTASGRAERGGRTAAGVRSTAQVPELPDTAY